ANDANVSLAHESRAAAKTARHSPKEPLTGRRQRTCLEAAKMRVPTAASGVIRAWNPGSAAYQALPRDAIVIEPSHAECVPAVCERRPWERRRTSNPHAWRRLRTSRARD